MPPETVQDLVSSGLIRLGNPQRYGGLGVEYDAAFDVSWELGRACGSTAWCYSLWTVHNWWVGHFPALAQEEFFASGPDTLASSALNPTRGQAEPVAGGLRVSGHWSFSSGCDAASWAMLAVPRPNGLIWTLATALGLRHPRHVVHLRDARHGQQGHRGPGCLCPGAPHAGPEPRRRWGVDGLG